MGNYAPGVNTVALDAARVPFANYLVAMHNRIHPAFAAQLLDLLSNLPKGHAVYHDLSAVVEIVVDKDTGKAVRMGIVRSSGNTSFDVAVLDSVKGASPFGKAPDRIASPDDKVYVHWEFHQDFHQALQDACSTRNARPFILSRMP